MAFPTIEIFPSVQIAPVNPFLFSGFLEHLGRCIYGGILPAGKSNFPYSARSPCPESKFTPTPDHLLTPSGFRSDVLAVIRDELQVPMIRWPGGNYVSSYNWKDAIGPQVLRKRRPELAWGGEESNQFGTDEFIVWCKEAKCEPYIIFNMGTGSLADALDWLDYCNGTGDTYYANLRRTHTGKDEPYNVKYWGLGNEVWGPWQIGQMSPEAYATQARQWAHALKLQDPTILLISCGETGLNPWDSHVLDALADKVDLHSIHLYTGFGPRDRTQTEKEYGRGVYGPDAAEYSIEVARGLINKARIVKNASKKIKLAFDEYGVWDETVGTPENGLEQYYNFTDALAMASWLNVFIRQADIVDIACIAQSVNVISPLITSPTGLFRQTIFHPLQLFSKYMRSGTSIQTSVQSPTFSGETLPEWISSIKGHPKDLDVSAVLATTPKRSLRISVINRNEKRAYQDVPIRIAFEDDLVGRDVEVHELWHEDIKAQNGWGHEDEVSVKTRRARWEGKWTFMEHSFTLFVLDL